MTKGITRAKGALTTAAAVAVLAAGLATPQWASAQPYDNGQQQQGTYYDPCQRDQSNREVAGGVLGAVTGAVIGNSVSSGGGRTGGTIIGGLAGAVVGAKVGQATAACGNGQQPAPAYYGGPPPPPPPPAQTYYAPPPPPPGPPPRECGRANERVFYPDGSTESYAVRACRDDYGRWVVVQ